MSNLLQMHEDKTNAAKKFMRKKSVYEKVMESDVELCQKVFRQFDTENKG